SVKLLPLIFHRQIEVGTLTLKDLALNLEKNAQGVSNWADLAKPEEKPAAPAAKPAAGGPPLAFSIGGLQVKDASLSYADKHSGASYQLQKLDVDTGEVRLGQPLDVKISFNVAASQPQMNAQTKAGFTLV